MSCGQMSQECTAGIQGLQGRLLLCVRRLLCSQIGRKPVRKDIYSLMLHLCSACHARENSNKVILSEDFKFSNTKDVGDY